jgi:ubiquinone/menaquinone biosynthesis C-methylase UbiE
LIATWRDFWDRPHRIYVNDRHRRVHYARVAADIISELPPQPGVLLDYGCGEALEAAAVAARCRKLYLCDSASNVRASLAARYAGSPTVDVLAPDQVATLPDASIDLVVANSVLQYLTREECTTIVTMLRRKLTRAGRLVIADVVPPGGSIVADVSSLLHTAWREGFFFAALAGLAMTFISDYRRLRNEIGLTTYSEREIGALLEQAGYSVERRARNFGFNQQRMTVIARPRN